MKNRAEKCGSPRSFILTLLNFRARTVAVLSGVLFQGVIVGSGFADEVIRWNQVATDASTAHKVDPLTESRVFAILHIAIHDAVNAVQARYQPYLSTERSDEHTSELQ